MLPTGIPSSSPDAIIMREIGARNAARSSSPSCATPVGHKQHHNFVITYGQCRNYLLVKIFSHLFRGQPGSICAGAQNHSLI